VDVLYSALSVKSLLLSPPSTNFRNMLDFMLAFAQHKVRWHKSERALA
jgi:hypothetical protein